MTPTCESHDSSGKEKKSVMKFIMQEKRDTKKHMTNFKVYSY